METTVQNYIQSETSELIHDEKKLKEWNKLRDELGLKGQESIVENVEGKDKSPVPFLYMNKGLQKIFNTLCERQENIKEYNKTPIPLEVMKLISLSKKEQYFGEIQIWYDDVKPDPIAVGVIGNGWAIDDSNNTTIDDRRFKSEEECLKVIESEGRKSHKPYHYSGNDKYYLLARWGDVAKPLEQLKKEAIGKYRITQTAKLNKSMRDIQRKLEDMEDTIVAEFN